MNGKTQTIGEILGKNRSKPPKSSTLDEHICDCGNTIEPRPKSFTGRTIWPAQCKPCRIKRDKEMQAQVLRKSRRTKQNQLRQRINAVVPELFRDAHIRDIPFVLRSKLLALVDNQQGAYMYGRPGTGKSYSLCAIARELITSGHKVRRVVWERLTLEIRGTYKRGDATELDIIKPLIDCDILFLEDIGTTVSPNSLESDFNLRVLLTIIDSRYEALRPTWITSNKSISQLEKSFDERIASRLSEHCKPICLEGRDHRRHEKPKLKLINARGRA